MHMYGFRNTQMKKYKLKALIFTCLQTPKALLHKDLKNKKQKVGSRGSHQRVKSIFLV